MARMSFGKFKLQIHHLVVLSKPIGCFLILHPCLLAAIVLDKEPVLLLYIIFVIDAMLSVRSGQALNRFQQKNENYELNQEMDEVVAILNRTFSTRSQYYFLFDDHCLLLILTNKEHDWLESIS